MTIFFNFNFFSFTPKKFRWIINERPNYEIIYCSPKDLRHREDNNENPKRRKETCRVVDQTRKFVADRGEQTEFIHDFALFIDYFIHLKLERNYVAS